MGESTEEAEREEDKAEEEQKGEEEEGEEEVQEEGAVTEDQVEVDLHRSLETGTSRTGTTRLRSRGSENAYVIYLRIGVWSMKLGLAYLTWATLIDCADGGHPPLSHKLRDVGDGEAPDSFCSELSLKRSLRITSLLGVTPCTADVCV
jgi:hypothetical protein